MLRKPTLIGLFLTFTILAGCFDADSTPQEEPGPHVDDGDETGPAQPGPSNDPPGILLTDLPWIAQDCHQIALPFYGASMWVDDNLPGPFTSSAGVTEALFLIVEDCAALTIGNATLIEPFQLAAVYAFVQKLDENSSRPEAYVFEAMINVERLVEAAQGYGWPVQLGSVSVSEDAPMTLTVSSPGMDYVMTILPVPGTPGPLDRLEYLWYVNDVLVPPLRIGIVESEDDGFLDAGVLQASRGTLNEAFAAGVTVGTPEQVTTSFRIDFQDLRQ